MADLTVEEIRTGVALVTLRRPAKLNALSWQLIEDLLGALRDLGERDDVRVVILTGEGRGFCSGMDLGGSDAVGTADGVIPVYRRQELLAGLATTLKAIPQPVIAAVNGPAAGGGLALALASDVRIASTAARFNAAFIRIGLSAGDVGVSHMLPRIVGLGIASELMLTGRQVLADEALRIGLANRVVEPDALIDTCLELADQIALNSPFGVWMTKQVLHRNVDAGSLEAAIELENRTQVLATRTNDMAEALDAFVAKRPPSYSWS
jgi:enoyl-CoA hydratase